MKNKNKGNPKKKWNVWFSVDFVINQSIYNSLGRNSTRLLFYFISRVNLGSVRISLSVPTSAARLSVFLSIWLTDFLLFYNWESYLVQKIPALSCVMGPGLVWDLTYSLYDWCSFLKKCDTPPPPPHFKSTYAWKKQPTILCMSKLVASAVNNTVDKWIFSKNYFVSKNNLRLKGTLKGNRVMESQGVTCFSPIKNIRRYFCYFFTSIGPGFILFNHKIFYMLLLSVNEN